MHPTLTPNLFFTVTAIEIKIISPTDITKAFQQSPQPTKRCFLEIDEAYQSWHKKRFREIIFPSLFKKFLGHVL